MKRTLPRAFALALALAVGCGTTPVATPTPPPVDVPQTDGAPSLDVPDVLDAPLTADAPLADLPRPDDVSSLDALDAPDVLDVLVVRDGPTTVDAPPADLPSPDDARSDHPVSPPDVATTDPDAPDALPACEAGRTRCGDACVALSGDPSHCGACGRVCATGQTCTAGACVGAATCPSDETRCGSACVDLRANPSHCGACGRACAAGQTCAAGVCVAARPGCAADQTDCAPSSPLPVCVNTTTDSRNCGACAAACPSGATCMGGACRCATGRTICERACVDTSTDAQHCGRCGNACAAGLICVAGACACAGGATLCGGACTDTRSDRNNCGACGRACPGGQSCVAGACVCGAGQTFCGSGFTGRCANLSTDRANCGACGALCTTGQSCIAGRCACPSGLTACGADCVDTLTSAAHCGRCNNACASGTSCTAGVCRGTPPANDTRAGATVIPLRSAPQDVAADTTSARNDTTPTCGCGAGNDVFFRFDLPVPHMIYADTFGATWDTSLFLQDASGANLGGALAAAPNVVCNDNNADSGLCPRVGDTGAQSQVMARLPPGTYYLVLSGCGAGRATIHFQNVPTGNGPTALLTADGIPHELRGTTSGAGVTSSGCCGTGPENAYVWVTCPGSAATTLYASSCNAATGANLSLGLDTSFAHYSGLRPSSEFTCNNDTGGTCGTGATLTSGIPATGPTTAGINVLLADGCGAAGGAYTLRYTIGACGSGVLCESACVATDSDERNCGGCNRRCASDQTCIAGMCRSGVIVGLPGETRFNAIAITGAAASLDVDTARYRSDTTGVCSCTTGKDVFYQFTLTAPSIVYADTRPTAGVDTSLFFQDASGANVTAANLVNGTTCNDDNGLPGCSSGARSQVMARLEPGTWFLVLSGCGAGGASTMNFQRITLGNGAVNLLPSGNSILSGTTRGTGRITSACCSNGPEDTWYWYTCPATPARGFTASTCDRATWNTSLSQVSPARSVPSVCNDDVGGLCVNRSTLVTGTIAGAGIHALYVDGCGASDSSGVYTLSVSR